VYGAGFTESLDQAKPIEDADLAKAIDINFKRLGAHLAKTDAEPHARSWLPELTKLFEQRSWKYPEAPLLLLLRA